jgi:hypothetical protein
LRLRINTPLMRSISASPGSTEAPDTGGAVDALRAKGLLSDEKKQRTDSTHVLTAIRRLTLLELVVETMRRVLDGIARVAPAWLQGQLQPEWIERYGRHFDSFRLPRSKEKRQVHLTETCTAQHPRLITQATRTMGLRPPQTTDAGVLAQTLRRPVALRSGAQAATKAPHGVRVREPRRGCGIWARRAWKTSPLWACEA